MIDVVDVGGFRIGFESRGSGPPLVLLHGALSDSRSWSRQLEGLSDAFTVVAWDAPGCGRSSDPPEDFRLSDYADCLAMFIRKVGIEWPHVLGHSFGSGLALEFYRRNPAVPRTLLLASAYAGWAGSLPLEEVRERVEKARRQSTWPPEKVVAEWLPTLFAGTVPDAVADETAKIISEFHPAGMRAMLNAFAAADLRDVLPTIEAPTLLIYGELDRRSPLSVARELQSKIPMSTLAVIRGAGHECNVEAPEAFNSEVRRFLASDRK